MAETTERYCVHCGGRQRIEEGLQRDFDGVLDERIGLQVAMRKAIEHLNIAEPMAAKSALEDALAVLDVVVENHPKPDQCEGDCDSMFCTKRGTASSRAGGEA
jgi:hypothetical protein